MNFKQILVGAIIPLALACLPGCDMLPEEEEFSSAPVIHDYQQQEYTTTKVMRGDLQLAQSIYCRYEPVKEQKLSFGVGGLYFQGVYVKKGDYVTKGTLLAELQMGSLKTDIADREADVSKLEMQKTQLKALMPMELTRHKLYLATLDKDNLASAQTLDEKRAELNLQMQSIDDELYIGNLKLKELEHQRDARQIVAGMDGTVMYIRGIKDGDTSTENTTLITLSDTESSMFSAETEYYKYLNPGDKFDLVTGNTTYPVQVVTADELGIEEPAPKGEKHTVFFKMLEPAVDLESGDRGTVTLILDTHKDTLYINTKAISTAEGRSFVYYIDKDGMRRMQEIKPGLVTDTQTEVLSGLNEGDEIIMS